MTCADINSNNVPIFTGSFLIVNEIGRDYEEVIADGKVRMHAIITYINKYY